MSERSEYYREYYLENRKRILSERKKRYHADVEYKENIKSRFRKRYASKLKSPDKGVGYTVKKKDGMPLFSIKYVSSMTGLSQSLIRGMEQRGILPKSIYTDSRGWRLYSEHQIKLIVTVLRKVPDHEAQTFLRKYWTS